MWIIDVISLYSNKVFSVFSNSKQKHKNYTELGMHINILHLRMS